MRNMFSVSFIKNQSYQLRTDSLEKSLIILATLSEILGPSLALANTVLQALENGKI